MFSNKQNSENILNDGSKPGLLVDVFVEINEEFFNLYPFLFTKLITKVYINKV